MKERGGERGEEGRGKGAGRLLGIRHKSMLTVSPGADRGRARRAKVVRTAWALQELFSCRPGPSM